MENAIEEIKKKIDIVEFIGSFITLKKAGKNFKAICPFHQEKTPSFIVSPERQIWHCFGACGEGGDVIKFLMKWENITFVEALQELAKKTGVTLKKISFEDKLWKKRERYFNMNLLAAEFFHFLLNNKKFGEKALGYLKNRGIKPAIIKSFQLGYAPSSWDSLRKFLKKKGYSDQEMYENGLLVKSEKGGYYDRFRGRLIFPLKDSRGLILGFSGRTLFENEKQAKYINSPETPIYHKRETLFGINLAKEAIKKENNVYIVEGEFDMITPFQYGFNNFVAIKGTALTNEQLLLLKRYTDRITLTLDSDQAGIESTKRGIEEAERLEFDIRVVILTSGKDPDEAVRNNIELFKKDIKGAKPIYDFLIEATLKKYPEQTSFDKKRIADEILPFIERILNPIVRSYYVKKLSEILGVSEASIEMMLKTLKRKKNQSQSFSLKKIKQTKENRELLIEKYLLSYLFQGENPFLTAEKVFKILEEKDFSQPSFQKILTIFFQEKKEKEKFVLNDFVKKLTPELREVFDEIYLFSSVDQMIEDESIEKIASEIKKNSLKRQIKKILEEEENEENKLKLVKLSESLKEVEKILIS